jgi:hypothetical protein
MRRYLKSNLYRLIYVDGLEAGRTGCFEYDLFPSKSKMYIDFPKSPTDKIVYVKIPSFHLINPSAKEPGALTIKFSASEQMKALSSVEVLDEINPFETKKTFSLSQAHYPQFTLDAGDYFYWLFPNYSNKLTIRKKTKGETDYQVGKGKDIVGLGFASGHDSTEFSLEDLLDDQNIPKEIRRELAFNLDLFIKDKNVA